MDMKNNSCSREVYEAAIGLARMWGVRETLEPLPCMGFSEMRDMVVEWAREYVRGGREDLVAFFQEKTGGKEMLDHTQ